MKTTGTKAQTIQRSWHLIDLEGQTLGRVASQIAQLLIGKHKTYFVPHLDCGDYVVVINAANIKVTGNKSQDKMYRRHSNYPGGLKELNFEAQMEKDPRQVIFQAVKGMIPKNKLRDPRMKRLKVFADGEHTYASRLEEASTKSAPQVK